METVISKDGTRIAFDKAGSGPAVILIAGAMGTRGSFGELAALLAPHFTAIAYDRRGRVDSGDTAPYAVGREIEDIEALIDAVGGSASLYGISSGAALALEAANALPYKVRKVALYEVPFIVDDSRAPVPTDYVPHLKQLIAENRRGDAVEYFMRAAIRIPEENIAQMRSAPMWPGLEAVAHTLAYDGMIMGKNMSGKPLRPNQWSNVTMPVLIMTGGNSPAFFHNGADAAQRELPNAQRHILPGQEHNVESAALAPVLTDFFSK